MDIVDEVHNYLIEKGRNYLGLIYNEYAKYFTSEQRGRYQQILDSDFIQVDMDASMYIANQSQNKQTSSNLDNIEVPLAHGARVFEDGKIHFYPQALLDKNPNLSVDEIKAKCEEILIHELFHFFVRPKKLDITAESGLEKITSYVTEGLVDMLTRDLQAKNGLLEKYNSNYGQNVMFVREMLGNIVNEEEKMHLIFAGTMEEILTATTTVDFDSKKEFIRAKNNETDFDKMARDVALTVFPGNEEKQNSIIRKINNSACLGKTRYESANMVSQSARQFCTEDILSRVLSVIEAYQAGIKSDFNLKESDNMLNEQKEEKPSFDTRKPSEVQMAEQIREKNTNIAQMNAAKSMETMQKHDKPKVLTLMPKPKKDNDSAKGFISILILISGLISLILAAMIISTMIVK